MLFLLGLSPGYVLNTPPRPLQPLRGGVVTALELPGPLADLVGSAPSDVSARSLGQKGVVITGGAGGVGYAYADSFMARGHWVVICDVKDPGDAVAALRAKHADGLGRVHGCVCD